MGSKRVGLARVQALIEGLKREINLSSTTLKGPVKGFRIVTASTELGLADSGTTILVNPAATTLIQLPGVNEVPTGWNVTIIIDEQDGGTMDQKVNIGTKSGEFFNGFLIASDGGGSVKADPSSNDFITCSTNSTCGEIFNILNDGTFMHATGNIVDASDTLFADAAG